MLCLAALLGFVAYLMPLALAAGSGDATDPLPLARYLTADHDLTARRPGGLQVAVPGAPVEGPVLARPAPAESDRADDGAPPGVSGSSIHRPDLSRSPPDR